MKIILAALLLTVSHTSSANVFQQYEQHLTTTLNDELSFYNGEVSELRCINHFVGVLCYGSLDFDNNSPSSCQETYYYFGLGNKVFERLCSTCSFIDDQDVSQETCH